VKSVEDAVPRIGPKAAAIQIRLSMASEHELINVKYGFELELQGRGDS
jgi:hypothetical protein